MIEDGSTASPEIKAARLRSAVEETFRKFFDDPRTVTIELQSPSIEFQIGLPRLIESYPQIKDLELRNIIVRKNPYSQTVLGIDLYFKDCVSEINMYLLEQRSEMDATVQQSKGYIVGLKDDAKTPIAECLRLQLIQEALDYVLNCRDAAKKI